MFFLKNFYSFLYKILKIDCLTVYYLFYLDTWESVYESAQVVISAALELKRIVEESSSMNHFPGVFALCRPPGHHANSNLCSGYCFLNNVAISAKIFTKDNKKVVILDIDYHQ